VVLAIFARSSFADFDYSEVTMNVMAIQIVVNFSLDSFNLNSDSLKFVAG
jgi:hypothetical protein